MSFGFHLRVCETLMAIAVRCSLAGETSTAARLFGAAQAGRMRLRMPPGDVGSYWAEQEAAVRAALGDHVFDAAYAEGNTLRLTEATGLALTVEHPDLALSSSRFSDLDSRSA